MPLITSSYSKPLLYQADIATILYGTIYGKLHGKLYDTIQKSDNLAYERESIEIPNNDFIDIDWIHSNSDVCILLVHGFEGSSESTAIRRLAKFFLKKSFSIAAVNFPGCSGRPNNLVSSYHSGAGHLIHYVTEHIKKKLPATKLYTIGISLGGNILLHYLADFAGSQVEKACAISVPCDLSASEEKIAARLFGIYNQNFLKSLKVKAKEKNKLFPGILSIEAISNAKRIREYDAVCTALLNGFRSVEEYYEKASTVSVINKIKTPTLLLSAKDDPFLSESCFPYSEAKESCSVFLETPEHGGHVAFPSSNYWLENRIVTFFGL